MLELIDSQTGVGSQGYELTRQYRWTQPQHDPLLIRAQVKVDSHAFQSSAKVQVLNAVPNWVTLVEVPPSQWFEARKSYVQVKTNDAALEELEGFVMELAQRGATVLEAWAS